MAKFTVEKIMELSPVVPVLVIDQLDDAVPLAEALLAGGIRILEITLRTEAALPAVERIAASCADAVVGVGTVTRPEQVQQAIDHGAEFIISPGVTPKLLAAVQDIPFLPGVASVSELMLGQEFGLQHFKFFPAVAAGGISLLQAFAGPFPHVQFCPTGGIGEHNFLDYLALSNVTCVGGSWVAPSKLIRAHDWTLISTLARQAVNAAAEA